MSAHGAGIIGFAMPDRPPIHALPMALLLHEPLDGPRHFDLLLAAGVPVGDDDRVVPTWRCEADPFELEIGSGCGLRPIDPHRGLYLRLETPRELDHGRGRVSPVHRGVHRMVTDGIEMHAGDRRVVVEMHSERLQRIR